MHNYIFRRVTIREHWDSGRERMEICAMQRPGTTA
jgi:hypothetical protein